MPPVEAISDAYKVGGIALVLLIILCVAGHLTFRFLIGLIHSQNERIQKVEDERANGLVAVIQACTQSNYAFVDSSKDTTQALRDLVAVSRERPCFETQRLPAVKPSPQSLRTPFPHIPTDR